MSNKQAFDNIAAMRGKLDSVSSTFCLAKWLQSTTLLYNGETHSCHHPRRHKINAEDLKEQMQKAEMKLNELADEVKIFGVRGTARVAKGTPSKQLQRIAVEIDASMIVIAKTGAGLVKGLPLGSTAQNLALNTNRPLLMLPEYDDI